MPEQNRDLPPCLLHFFCFHIYLDFLFLFLCQFILADFVGTLGFFFCLFSLFLHPFGGFFFDFDKTTHTNTNTKEWRILTGNSRPVKHILTVVQVQLENIADPTSFERHTSIRSISKWRQQLISLACWEAIIEMILKHHFLLCFLIKNKQKKKKKKNYFAIICN